jgi:DNA-binding LacI/PurR family transcriptional regulator
MLDTLGHVASNIGRERYLATFLDGILRRSAATAWVCADDMTAIGAASFLRSRGKRVPEDISVIGFDNFRESHEHQVSTFDFNMNGMVQQAMLMIMDEAALRSRPAISEVDGYVVERRTTGKR